MTSVVRRREHDDSGEYSDVSQENEQNHSGNDIAAPESDYDSRGSDSDLSEKEEDGQEAEPRVDDDEDRSNPQYIPKRGTFYEHDDRTAASGEETTNTTASDATVDKKEPAEPPVERRRPPRKSEIIDKWSHDKYNENEQTPKSRDELVAIYGYDIRNEDAPPHARRNRRYGRGPNKYTRTWEDENAYRRQANVTPQTRKPPNPEDFPELDASAKRPIRKRPPRPRSKSQPAVERPENGSNLRRNASIKSPKTNQSRPTVRAPNKVNARPNGVTKPVPNKGIEKLPQIENLTITANIGNNGGQAQRKVNTSIAQQRPVPTVQGKKPSPQTQTQQPNLSQAPQSQSKQNAQQAQQQPTQPLASTESRSSKRYSSLRQRPLAEPYAPQQHQQQPQIQQQQPQLQQQPQPQPQPQVQAQQHRYAAEYAQQPQAGQHQGSPAPQLHPQQQIIHQVHRTTASQQQHGPSPPHQALPQTQQQVRLGLLEQQQLVSHPHHQMHNMPPPQQHTMSQIQPAQGYAPPAMMPAQFMQGGNNAVYAGAPMYAPPPQAPYPHQMYQHHNYATQAGGVTYYSTAEQESAVPRAQRRPTAAIPIVRPTQNERQPNSAEKDSIDRIVENMFVRKPWPVAGADQKSQTEKSSQEPKETSQPNSLTSSSISNESRPSVEKEEKEKEVEKDKEESPPQDTKEEVNEVLKETENPEVSA